MATMNDDELYLIARRVLLDALDALGEHRDALALVAELQAQFAASAKFEALIKGNLKGLGYAR
jgi:hypothetical protein